MAHVVILAAGYATRLYPLTENFPKPLLEVGGKPIINHLLDALQPISKEISGVACVTNDLYAPHFEKWAKELNVPFPVSVVNDGTRTNDTRLGAIRDIGLAAESFNNNDDLLVLAGDNIFDSDLALFYQKSKSRPNSVTLACIDVGDRKLATQYGILEVGEESRIVQFHEKPKNPPSTLASTGIYFFSQSTLHFFNEFLNDKSLNHDAPGFFISWLVSRVPVYGELLDGIWYDIGDKASLKNADEIFTKKKEKSAR